MFLFAASAHFVTQLKIFSLLFTTYAYYCFQCNLQVSLVRENKEIESFRAEPHKIFTIRQIKT